jgi:hypothetical protein
MNNISSYLSQAGNAIGAAGNFINKNQAPLMLAAEGINTVGNYGLNSGRNAELLKIMKNRAMGQLAGQGIAAAQPPTQQPTPQGKPKVITTTNVQKVEMMDTNGDGIGDTPAPAGGPFKVNPALDPRAQMLSAGPTATPVQGTVPNFPGGTGGSNVATSVPVQTGATNAPSVQNLNVAAPLTTEDYGNIGWMGGAGTAMDVAKTVATNRLTGRGHDIESAKLGPATTQAEAALIKANTDAGKLELERGEQPYKLKKLSADTSHAIAQYLDTMNKATGAGAYSPEAQANVEIAKKRAETMVKIEEDERYYTTPQASLAVPAPFIAALGLNPAIKTYADLARTLGGKSNLEKAMSDYVSTQNAKVNAGGVVDAQKLTALMGIKDIQQKELDQIRTIIKQRSDPSYSLLMKPEEKAANSLYVKMLSENEKLTTARLANTEGLLVGKVGGSTSTTPSAPPVDRTRGRATTDEVPAGHTVVTEGKDTFLVKDGKKVAKWTGSAPPPKVKSSTTSKVDTKVVSPTRPEGVSPREWARMTPIERIAFIDKRKAARKTAYYE